MQITTLRATHHPTKICLILLALALILSGCTSGTVQPTQTPAATQTATQTAAKTQLPTALPSVTTTRTMTPTITPVPTKILSTLNHVATLGKGSISPVFRSPDGKKIIVSGTDGMARWFDVETGKELGTVKTNIFDAFFSPDSRIVALETFLGFMVIDLDESKVISDLEKAVIAQRTSPVFSPDMRFLALLNEARTTREVYEHIEIIRLEGNGEPEYLPVGDEDEDRFMTAPEISPDSSLVVAGCSDKRVYVWNAETGQIRFMLEGHTEDILDIAFNSDGNMLVSSSEDGTLRVWNPYSGKLIRVISGFSNSPTSVRFTADGLIRVGVKGELTGQLVNPLTGEKRALPLEPEITRTPDPYEVNLHQQGYLTDVWQSENPVLFNRDGTILAVGGRNILLWDVTGKKLLKSLEVDTKDEVDHIAFSPDGNWLAASYRNNGIQVWDINHGELIFDRSVDRNQTSNTINAPTFSPDGTQLAFGIGNRIEIWDLTSKKLVRSLKLPESKQYATQVAYSKDGSHLYSIINGNMGVQIWDLNSGKLISQAGFEGYHQHGFSASDLNPPYFARNNENGTASWIDLWNLNNGQIIKLPMENSLNAPISFSPDGSLFMSQNYFSKQFFIWRTDTGERIYNEQLNDSISPVISPNLNLLAIGYEGIVNLFDLTNVMQGHKVDETFTPTPAH